MSDSEPCAESLPDWCGLREERDPRSWGANWTRRGRGGKGAEREKGGVGERGDRDRMEKRRDRGGGKRRAGWGWDWVEGGGED